MNAGNNFVDLRITHAGISGDSDDSVWPAFTDIMTVVLMIFLISMVTFLIRNTQLVDELQTALIEKDQISEHALLSEQQNQSLESQLALVRQRILSLESTLLNETDAKDILQITLDQRIQTVRDLETEIALLIKLRDQLSNSNSDLLSKLDLSEKSLTLASKELTDLSTNQNTLNDKISLLLAEKAGLILGRDNTKQQLNKSQKKQQALSNQVISLTEQLRLINDKLDNQDEQLNDQRSLVSVLNTDKVELKNRLKNLVQQLKKLQISYESRGAIVDDLQAKLNQNEISYKSLQDEYDTIDEQYRKLIRPARNLAGKVVVRVTLAKTNDVPAYMIQMPGQTQPQTIPLAQLHTKLAKLKSKHQQNLYTKVIIDDKSGIEFNQAWRFTQDILSKYDYYQSDYAAQPVAPKIP